VNEEVTYESPDTCIIVSGDPIPEAVLQGPTNTISVHDNTAYRCYNTILAAEIMKRVCRNYGIFLLAGFVKRTPVTFPILSLLKEGRTR
jgi:hypothetical protein